MKLKEKVPTPGWLAPLRRWHHPYGASYSILMTRGRTWYYGYALTRDLDSSPALDGIPDDPRFTEDPKICED